MNRALQHGFSDEIDHKVPSSFSSQAVGFASSPPLRFENGALRFSVTVGEIFFNAALKPKLLNRAKVRGGDETSSSGFG